MCNITGLGIDICSISKMEENVDCSRFLDKYFSEEEISYISSKGQTKAQTMAGIWCAKEAALKALGCGIVFPLKEIAVTHSSEGKPQLKLLGSAAEKYPGCSFMLSITHDGDTASAVCIVME